MTRTPAEAKLDALNQEMRELLHKKAPTRAEKRRINQINGTLLPNTRRVIEEQKGRNR